MTDICYLRNVDFGMALVNTLDKFLKERGVERIVQFQRDTGLPEATARRLFKRRDVFPDKASIDKICKAYKARPGEFLDYILELDEAS